MIKYLISLIFIILSSCNNENISPKGQIKFAVSAEYPPFEYYKKGKITGFDIDLAELIAKEMGLVAIFEDMPFYSIFLNVKNNNVDAAISTITVTNERAKEFTFSVPYYNEKLAAIFRNDSPIHDNDDILNKKIACQLGTTMELWLRKNFPKNELLLTDHTNQAIESLKSFYVDVVLIDAVQAHNFVQKNKNLSYKIVDISDIGYSIILKTNSSLKDKIDIAILSLREKGEIKKLEKKWLELDE
jgi:polar amino acid transport system substrate-binding protein